MLTLFRSISVILMCCIFFYVFFERVVLTPWETLPTTGDEMVSSGVIQSCIKNPHIEFFMYHYIRDHDMHDALTTKDLSVDPALFRRHMQKIQSLAVEKKISLMKWDDFIASIRSWCFPDKNIWLFTADDGWIDMRDYLAPIATEYGIPFYLGIITGKLDMPWFLWTNDIIALSKNPLISIASHSVNHIDNSKLNEVDETHEMCDSRKLLQEITGQAIDTYIYPSGRINPELDEIIAKKCGYTLGWSTSFGDDYNSHTGSIYDLNRTRISSDTDPSFFDRILSRRNHETSQKE